ncbi:MAG: DUF4926 domain-containing protein [Gemmatimonadales bacterium]
MTYAELETVVLARDLPEVGLKAGDLGAIVHVHSPTSFDVEFVRASGATQALVTVSLDQLRSVTDRDLIAVRPADPPAPGPI